MSTFKSNLSFLFNTNTYMCGGNVHLHNIFIGEFIVGNLCVKHNSPSFVFYSIILYHYYYSYIVFDLDFSLYRFCIHNIYKMKADKFCHLPIELTRLDDMHGQTTRLSSEIIFIIECVMVCTSAFFSTVYTYW